MLTGTRYGTLLPPVYIHKQVRRRHVLIFALALHIRRMSLPCCLEPFALCFSSCISSQYLRHEPLLCALAMDRVPAPWCCTLTLNVFMLFYLDVILTLRTAHDTNSALMVVFLSSLARCSKRCLRKCPRRTSASCWRHGMISTPSSSSTRSSPARPSSPPSAATHGTARETGNEAGLGRCVEVKEARSEDCKSGRETDSRRGKGCSVTADSPLLCTVHSRSG